MKSKVILRKDIPALGNTGDLIEVAAGYARNYLVPSGLAFSYSEDANLRVEKDRQVAVQYRAELEAEYASLAARVGDVQLTFDEKVSAEGHLYGSVNIPRIREMLASQGLDLEERNIRLPEPIRSPGEYEVPIHIHGDLEVAIKVWVVATMAEGEIAMAEERAAEAAAEAAAVAAAEDAAEAAAKAEFEASSE